MAPKYSNRAPSHDNKIQIALRPVIGTSGRIPLAAQPWLMESAFLHLELLTPEGGFESEEELERLVKKYLRPGKKRRFPKPIQSWHQAQELAYSGWEKKNSPREADDRP